MDNSSFFGAGEWCAMIGLFVSLLTVGGQTTVPNYGPIPPPTPWQITKREGNHRHWERIVYEKSPDGRVVARKHGYEELAGGICYQDSSGQWQDSQEQIEPYATGAIARQGQYQTIFANNLNSTGAIDQQTSDGKRLRSNILGLAYYDSASGQSVLIAQVQDSSGELISANQVLYPNAFNGVKADVRYTYKKGSFEQDVILREQPPTPESVGLSSSTTEIEVLTEFINPPPAKVENRHRASVLPDDDVSWGVSRLGHGKAFDLDDSSAPSSQIHVRRQYGNIQGRTILIEAVPFPKITPALSRLPLQSSIHRNSQFRIAKTLPLPPRPLAQQTQKPIKIAFNQSSSRGFVLDYVQINTSESDLTFQGDTTYYISGNIYVSGPTVIEGGAVLKFGPYGTIVPDSEALITCRTGPYRPAVLTSVNDNTLGDAISGSSGNPTNNGVYISFLDNPSLTQCALSNLRVSYANIGILDDFEDGSVEEVISDSQFIHCTVAVDSFASPILFNNDLFSYCLYGVTSENDANVQLTHSTGDSIWQFYNDVGVYGGNPIELTNSILSNVTNMIGIYTNPHYTWPASVTLQNSVLAGPINRASIVSSHNSYQPASGAGLYQVMGGGNYYLATNSPYRGAGTPDLDQELLTDISAKTTWPPNLFLLAPIFLGTNVTFGPSVPRDTNVFPDLGYHYDPLDYMLNPTYITNATMTVDPGAALGFYGVWGSYNFGVAVAANATLMCDGMPNNPAWMVAFNTVQEQTPAGWVTPQYGLVAHYDAGNMYQITSRFTDWSVLAQDDYIFQMAGGTNAIDLQDSEFYGGQFETWAPSFNLTNCLLWRVNCFLYPDDNNIPVLRNNTFIGGTFEFGTANSNPTNAFVQDNLFDQTSIPFSFSDLGETYYGGYNAYVTNCGTLNPSFPGDLILTNSPAYESSFFGNYYLPPNSPLLGAGSTTANLLGLYHYTTQTNQVPQGDAVVDIGYHYVATDQYGNPLDTNGDGVPDYLEDANGDGIYDAGDLANWLINPYNGLSSSSGLTIFTPLK